MYQQYLRTILVLLLINDIKSDVRELKINERGYLPPIKKGNDHELKAKGKEYLPPDKNSGEIKEIGLKGEKYLPPAERDSKEDLTLKESLLLPPVRNNIDKGYLPPEKSHYIHNKPKVIDDPLPKKIDYKQPLSLDFLTGQYKPTFEGGLISGLFVNENQIQKLNSEKSNELNHNKNVKMFLIKSNPSKLNTKVDYILKLLKSEVKAESSNRNNKYVKIVDDSEEIVPINHYEDKDMIYILFNYEDDTELSASAPVVIYKPGDDLAFTEDTTVIDNYEHVFPMEILSGNKTTTTTTTTPKTTITTRTTSTTTTTTTPAPSQEPRSFKISHSKEEKGNRSSSKDSKSDLSRNRSLSEENKSDLFKNRSSSDGNKSDHTKNQSSGEENKSDLFKNRFSSDRNRSDSFKNRSSGEEKEKETESDHSKQRSSSEETENDHSKQRSSSKESKSNNSKDQSFSKGTENDHSKQQISSEEKSESDHPDHQSSKHGGYTYEKPKIPFTF